MLIRRILEIRSLAAVLVAVALGGCGSVAGADAAADAPQADASACRHASECPSGSTCIAGACQPSTPCTSSRMCPGLLCNTVTQTCVECVQDTDCPTSGARCR